MTKPFFTAGDFPCRSLQNSMQHATGANAKVAPLIAENERLKKEIEVTYEGGIISVNGKAIADHSELPSINEKLTEQNRLMREALEFYADAKTWENAERFRRCVGTDGSNTAREALAKCKELEK